MANPPTTSHLEDGKVEISTEWLLLRGAREEDVGGLHEAFSDPEVMRYWSTTPHTSPLETATWVQKMISSHQNGTTDFIITHKATSQPIGKIGVWQSEEIGFLLSRAYWEKGLAQEALAAVLEYLFRQRGLEEITADVDPRNERSVGLLQRVGFVVVEFKESTWEVGGEWVDSLYLSLKKEGWEARRGER